MSGTSRAFLNPIRLLDETRREASDCIVVRLRANGVARPKRTMTIPAIARMWLPLLSTFSS